MTRDEQIMALRRMAVGNIHQWVFGVCVAAALAFMVAAWQTRTWGLLLFSGFFAWLIAALRQTMPHVRNAVRALDHGVRHACIVDIKIETWSDSVTYELITPAAAGRDAWRFKFIPVGWKPVFGSTPAEVVFLDGLAWPALVVTEHGVLHPRQTPTRMPR